MKRLAVLATVVVQVLAVGGVAMATPIPGPTPERYGCVCVLQREHEEESVVVPDVGASRTYGIPVDGATLARGGVSLRRRRLVLVRVPRAACSLLALRVGAARPFRASLRASTRRRSA